MITCQSVFLQQNGGQKDISCVWWRMLDVTSLQIHLQHDTPIDKPNNTVAGQGMNIEILPPKKGTSNLSAQLITFKSTVHVELDHRMKYAWATAADRLTSPKYLLRDRIKLFPQQRLHHFFYASGTWTMTEELKKTLWTKHRPMMRMIVQT